MSLSENALLTAVARQAACAARASSGAATVQRIRARGIKSFDVRTRPKRSGAVSLSGGNLQKFVVGREILQTPGMLVVSQPTWGVDAGAAAVIRQALVELAESGAAVVIVSQDLDEIFLVCDRVAVIAGGRLSAADCRRRGDARKDRIGDGRRRPGARRGGPCVRCIRA